MDVIRIYMKDAKIRVPCASFPDIKPASPGYMIFDMDG